MPNIAGEHGKCGLQSLKNPVTVADGYDEWEVLDMGAGWEDAALYKVTAMPSDAQRGDRLTKGQRGYACSSQLRNVQARA